MSELQLEDLRQGDLVMIRWSDASDIRCSVEEHERQPEVHVKDWGVYLGVCGRKRRLVLIGKDVVEVQNDWGATRIPVDLIEEVRLLMPRDQVVGSIAEVQALTRRVKLRKWRREGFRVA